MRAREVARQEPVGRPLAESAQLPRAAPSPRRRAALRARAGRGRCARDRARTPPCDREKPTARRSSSLTRARRSRVGKANASVPGSPYRSMRRLRIAKAEWSETCCAVIEVTSDSNGSGASGGRKPASSGRSRRSTSSSVCPGIEGVQVERRAEQCQHLSLDLQRPAARRRRRRAPPRSAPPALRSRGAARPRARGSRGRRRRRGSARSRRRSRRARAGGRASPGRVSSPPGRAPIEAVCAASPSSSCFALPFSCSARSLLPPRRRRKSRGRSRRSRRSSRPASSPRPSPPSARSSR